MKYISLLLASCVAASANAATYNAQGKIISSKDAKNPGIVKFEKNKAAIAKNKLNTPASLARTYTPAAVQATKAVYDQNAKTYQLDNRNYSESAYFEEINRREQNDQPRQNTGYKNYSDYGLRSLPNKTGNNCSRVNSNFANEYYYFDYDYVSAYRHSDFAIDNATLTYAIGYYDNDHNYDMNVKMNNSDVSFRCLGMGGYSYTCGEGIHLYNIAGDAPVSFNGNSCVDSRTQNYKEGIKHYYANKFINYLAERTTLHYYKDRALPKLAQHPANPYANNMHIGNIISASYKNQTTYNKEAAALDDYIYNNRVIEFAPYINDGGRTGAGLALNAITVASATSNWGFYKTETPSGQSIWGHITLEENPGLPLLKSGNNNSKFNKPEIYNASAGLFSDETKIKHDNNEYEYEALSGDWGASTVSAAMTADLLQKHPFYKWHPEVVKALWISASYKRTDSDDGRTNIYNRNTAQYVGSLTTFDDLLSNNKSRYWYGNNTDFLSNNKISFAESVEPGQKYNFAIAWLVRGDYALYEYNLSTNFKLTISYTLPSGSTKTYSSSDGGISRPATYRSLKNITIPSGVSSVTVTIERTKDTGDRIILGYNKHKMRYN